MVCFAWNVRYINNVYNKSGRGSVWLERCVRDAEAGGSNPLAPTNFFKIPMESVSMGVFFFVDSYSFIPAGNRLNSDERCRCG